ncbi:hypothetical protein V6N13_020720 [Hibiscus sabdariffa]
MSDHCFQNSRHPWLYLKVWRQRVRFAVYSYHQLFRSSKTALLFVVLDVKGNQRSLVSYSSVAEDLKQW